MTNEEVLVELAILDAWEREFPTTDKDVLLAQKLQRERLSIQLLTFDKRNGQGRLG